MSGPLTPRAPWPHEPDAGAAGPGGGAAAWWRHAQSELAAADSTYAAAARAGERADRVGYAFAGGYAAALWTLVPSHDRGRLAALCVTEAEGNHPRAIATRVQGGALTGDKSFVTLGQLAEDLYVLAAEGDPVSPAARPTLGLYRVRADAAGAELAPAPSTPFCPEIPHATLTLRDVRDFERLPGDGWSDYVRPFRTVEDALVHVALVAHLVACGARWSWDRALLARGMTLLAALRAIVEADPSDPVNHLALAGAIDATAGLVDSATKMEWPDEARARFDRDRPLLSVASKARSARTAKAWERLG